MPNHSTSDLYDYALDYVNAIKADNQSLSELLELRDNDVVHMKAFSYLKLNSEDMAHLIAEIKIHMDKLIESLQKLD